MKTYRPKVGNTYPLTKLEVFTCKDIILEHARECRLCAKNGWADEELHNQAARARVKLRWNWGVWAQYGIPVGGV